LEISGISFIGASQLACVQDELGKIYIYDYQLEEVVHKVNFGEKGDYEDIAVVGNDAWIVRSDGKLYHVQNFASDNPKVEKYATPLTRENNAEGLCYDDQNQSLLILCKENATIEHGISYKNSRAVYEFDLKNKEFKPEARYIIRLDALETIVEETTTTPSGNFAFRPSGIAINPLNRDVYIVSSVGKLLLTLSAKGEIKRVQKMSKKVNKQPEGICFNTAGDLFISNEGRKGKGNILWFKHEK
ncbi:MAG: hypothetical protein CSA05_02385, partial [Bacteroidia bacterium]